MNPKAETNTDHPDAETRSLETAGEKRRAAMIAQGVESYRSLRAHLNGGDMEEIRSAGPTYTPLSKAIKEPEIDLSWIPEDRDMPWHEFAPIIGQLVNVNPDSGGFNVAVEGFLTFLQANRLAIVSGGRRPHLTIRRLPRPRATAPSPTVRFIPDTLTVDPIKRLDELERRVQRLEVNVRV